MILRDGIVLLEFTDLVNDDCLGIEAYRSAQRRGLLHVVQKGGGGHPALIDWASLPERYQALVRAHLGGDPVELAQVLTLERHLRACPADERYIDEFRSANGKGMPAEKRRKLKEAARVVALLVELDERHRTEGALAPRYYGFDTVLKMKDAVLRYIRAKGVDLPTSFSRLEARKRAYRDAVADGHPGASALLHGGLGNRNAARLQDQLQMEVLEGLASRHQNFSKRRIADDYTLIAQQQGWAGLTANTVARYLRQGEVSRSVTLYARGAAAYQAKHGIVVHRSRPSQPTYLWVHDATTYELYYQRQANRRTYYERKTVCVVVDAHSWYPVGYAIGEEDTIALTQEAMRNAVAHLAELTGHYVLPHQVQSDRLGHKALGRWYDGMGIHYTPAAARNPRSKVVEPWFKHHHVEHVKPYCPNWSGHNITARTQPNPDALERLKKQFPDEAGVVQQIHEAFQRERAAKAEAFRAALQAMPEVSLRAIGRADYLEHFGLEHAWQNELTNRGLCPTLLGEERVYNLLSHDWQQWVGTRFSVKYDPADLRSVLAVAHEGSLRFVVPQVAAVPMALADHTPETRAQLARVEAFKKELGQAAIDRRADGALRLKDMAARLLEQAAAPVKPTKATERALEPGRREEAAVRAYEVEAGSHKQALRAARQVDDLRRTNPERFAEEQL